MIGYIDIAFAKNPHKYHKQSIISLLFFSCFVIYFLLSFLGGNSLNYLSNLMKSNNVKCTFLNQNEKSVWGYLNSTVYI